MSEIKTDELIQASETGNAAAETPIVEEINAPKAKNTFKDFFKKCFSKENLKKTIAVILLTAIVIGGTYGVIYYNSPESVALRFVKACSNSDLKAQEKLLAYDYRTYTLYLSNSEDEEAFDEEAFFESKSDKFEEDINSWEDYFRVYQTQALEFYEDIYGDYKITYSVSKTKDLSERKVKASNESLLSDLEEIANFDSDTIEEGKYVTVKGKTDTEELGIIRYTYTVTLVKVSNSWKVLDYDVKT